MTVDAMVTTVKPWNEAEVHACIERMLASPFFAHAERQKRLLRYLVSATVAGRADLLKGYTIGVEVFDRGANFDPAIDAIVRVQAGHLRAKLREYYDREGSNDPVRFELPKGNYAVRIERGREQALREAAAEIPPFPLCKRGGGGGILQKGVLRSSGAIRSALDRPRTSLRSPCCPSPT